jgi:hypothetical protein
MWPSTAIIVATATFEFTLVAIMIGPNGLAAISDSGTYQAEHRTCPDDLWCMTGGNRMRPASGRSRTTGDIARDESPVEALPSETLP